MKTQFSHAGIIGRIENPNVTETLNSLVTTLKTLEVSITAEQLTAEVLSETVDKIVPKEQLADETDIIIVVGGDGSLLSAAHSYVDSNTPLLGINRGSLGFLTNITPEDMEHQITDVFSGRYQSEERFLLECHVVHGDKTLKSHALNEIAMLAQQTPKLVDFEIHINNKIMCSQRSDGVIVATPTGSTAYALSGGGPILHPNLDAFVIVPMFPHTLSLRPIVVTGDSVINIVVTKENQQDLIISCDGQNHIPITSGDEIKLMKKAQTVKLIHPQGYDYYEALRSKMHWARKLTDQ